MKKTIFLITTAVLFVLLAVSALAAETPVEMTLTGTPEKIVYGPADAVSRTQNVWDAAANTIQTVEYDYYPIDFSGLEITFTYADQSTQVLRYDEALSLENDVVGVKNSTVQDADHQWAAGNTYTVVLTCGTLKVEYAVSVAANDVQTEEDPVSFEAVTLPEKTVYMPADGVQATGFDKDGKVVSYTAFVPNYDGLVFQLTYKDGSIQFCTLENLSVLTGLPLIVSDGQSAQTPWTLGANAVTFTLGTCKEEIVLYLDVEDHKVDSYVSTGNDKHSGQCTYCRQTITRDCEGGTVTCFQQAVCVVCKTAYGEKLPHELNYTSTVDTHSAVCKNCDYILTATEHNFAADKYDTQNNRVLCICADCNYSAYCHVLGDVETDGTISAADARLALRASVELDKLDAHKTKLADVNKDGSITAADARLLLRASVGLEEIAGFVAFAAANE